MTIDRTTSREEGLYELMGDGGGVLSEAKEERKMVGEVREILMNPDFKKEDLSSDQARFVEGELDKLARTLHQEDRPNVRLNQILESEDLEQMAQFARDHILAKLENPDSDKVVPIQKRA